MDVAKFSRANSLQLARGFLGIALVATAPLQVGCEFAIHLAAVPFMAMQGSRALPSEAFTRVRGGSLNLIGKVGAGDVLPAGELHHISFPYQDANVKVMQEGLLVVNFDSPTSKGERSYLASVVANCSTGALTVDYSSTYEGLNSQGPQVAGELLSAPLIVDRPSVTLALAVQAICTPRYYLLRPIPPEDVVATFNDRHQLAGPFKGYGTLRLGEMYVNTTSIHSTNVRQQRTAYLLVNVESDNSSTGTVNGRSYIAEATVDCSRSYFTIDRVRNFSDTNAMGNMVRSQEISPPLLIVNDLNNPDTALRKAADIVCKS